MDEWLEIRRRVLIEGVSRRQIVRETGMRGLFPRYFFLVTNWWPEQKDSWALLEHYRKRGTFEDRLGEFNAVIGKGLSAASFEANEASLLLKLLAYNLAGMLRGELEDASGTGWDLKRVQQTVLKAGAGSSWMWPVRPGCCGADCWNVSIAGGGMRRGPAEVRAGAGGWPRRPMPTCAWCCGNELADNPALRAALQPMGVRGRFARTPANQPSSKPSLSLTHRPGPMTINRYVA